MEINIPQLQKKFEISVNYNESVKNATNRSFSNASPCCNVELQQKKFCANCNKEVDTKQVTNKILKAKNLKVVIPAKKLEEIEDVVAKQATEIKIKAIIERPYDLPFDRIDGARYTQPAKKVKDYLELKEICEDFILIGEGVLKSNGYEVALVTIGDNLVLIKFASEARMNAKPNLEGIEDISVNEELVNVEKTILAKTAVEDYDYSVFEDTRTKQVDELIEKIAISGEIPVIETKADVAEEIDETSELDRLKALLTKTEEAAEA